MILTIYKYLTKLQYFIDLMSVHVGHVVSRGRSGLSPNTEAAGETIASIQR